MSVRPYLQSHGGDVEIVRIEDGTAFVRLHGTCSGCSMSAVTLREGVEEALVSGVDEIERIEELEDQPTTAFIPLDRVGRKRETGWVRGPAVEEIPLDGMLRIDVTPDGADAPASFVVTNVGRSLAVFRNECVHQGMTLDGGMIDDGVLTCPWHGFRFDASTGECISAPGAQLSQVPTRLDDGHVWIRASGA
jgi:Fe-S cluster biogenesis protein NfuA/nitrite reductase/ring-hydroxylating ferredoxin subunit